jgi:hypothetical protein
VTVTQVAHSRSAPRSVIQCVWSMSFGQQIVPVINSEVDYQNNRVFLEKARQAIEEYAAMNEEAKLKYEYEQDLSRKIADGERAR